jgi:hypothetical protein
VHSRRDCDTRPRRRWQRRRARRPKDPEQVALPRGIPREDRAAERRAGAPRSPRSVEAVPSRSGNGPAWCAVPTWPVATVNAARRASMRRHGVRAPWVAQSRCWTISTIRWEESLEQEPRDLGIEPLASSGLADSKLGDPGLSDSESSEKERSPKFSDSQAQGGGEHRGCGRLRPSANDSRPGDRLSSDSEARGKELLA